MAVIKNADLDTPEARLDMVRPVLRAILACGGEAAALARAGLDLCDLTAAERAEMRGEE